jgi:hypothetical protein
MRQFVSRGSRWVVLALLLGLVALPARGIEQPARASSQPTRLSQGVLLHRWLTQPSEAPEQLQARFQAAHDQVAAAGKTRAAGSATASPLAGARFNHDVVGLPQNEESIGVCRSNRDVVLGGTNDYRGLLDPQGNFTGWHFSNDGGASLTNEGLLPPVTVAGTQLASQGDPVDVAGLGCRLYAADLNFNAFSTTAGESAIGAYRTTPARLASCPGGADPSCWPTRRAVAVNEAGHFLDKPWMDVGVSGSAGEVVWVTYTDFNCPNPDCSPPFTNQIKAVRCNAPLTSCTEPILLSGAQNSLQFSDVTIGPDGRVYVTWEEDNDLANNFEPPERMRFWLRVAEPGSTTFGPLRRVADEPLNLGIADLHANDFRVATYPKNTVAMVGGRPRVFVVWDGCRARTLGDTVCEEPAIKLRYSDDAGVSWSRTQVLSAGGDNYFPTIDADRGSGRVAVAWYTSRFDPVFHNRQDVELVSLNRATAKVVRRQRVTRISNDPEADPLLGGAFIGDYFEVAAEHGTGYVHFNANYVSIRLLGEGVPIPQQDNFLIRKPL